MLLMSTLVRLEQALRLMSPAIFACVAKLVIAVLARFKAPLISVLLLVVNVLRPVLDRLTVPVPELLVVTKVPFIFTDVRLVSP